MNKTNYQLRLRGLTEASGEITAAHLRNILQALETAAARAVRLRVVGEGRPSGKPPGWLKSSTDLLITGMRAGSTVLDIAAPQLRDTAGDALAQDNLLGDPIDLQNTALDLTAQAAHEIMDTNSAGNYFDNAVLDAFLQFKNIAGGNVVYELISQQSRQRKFILGENFYAAITRQQRNIPPPKAHIISGVLNQIEHSNGHFHLRVNGKKFGGCVDRQALSLEKLRDLWGCPTIVEGMLHFKVDGSPRLIKARKITRNDGAVNVFHKLPVDEHGNAQSTLLRAVKASQSAAGLMQLWEKWPGDESFEEVLAQLD